MQRIKSQKFDNKVVYVRLKREKLPTGYYPKNGIFGNKEFYWKK